MAFLYGISKSCVQRFSQPLGRQPHCNANFKLSGDRSLPEPPGKAFFVYIDDRNQCRALECTNLMLRMGFGNA